MPFTDKELILSVIHDLLQKQEPAMLWYRQKSDSLTVNKTAVDLTLITIRSMLLDSIGASVSIRGVR